MTVIYCHVGGCEEGVLCCCVLLIYLFISFPPTDQSLAHVVVVTVSDGAVDRDVLRLYLDSTVK